MWGVFFLLVIIVDKILYSSKTEEWETPLDLFDHLNRHFKFTLDPCATKENAKCLKFFTKEINGLLESWENETVFMNPPYGRVIYHWVEKAYEESRLRNATVVCLLPVRTDTKWWQNFCTKGKVKFLLGRLKFSGSKNSAPFPSAIVVFHKSILFDY